MDSQTRLFAFLIFTNLSIFVLADDNWNCSETSGTYDSNSGYSTNLHKLLPSLYSKMDDSGFHSASEGKDADQIYAIALCRADLQLDNCSTCVQNASDYIVQKCPNSQQAIYWMQNCMLRYSNEPLFGIPDNDTTLTQPECSLNNATSAEKFDETLWSLVDRLSTEAASGGSQMKVAADKAEGPDSQIIYALLQCTPDISEDACKNCLMECKRMLPDSCDNITRRGERILLPSCNLRYEGDPQPFYNLARIEEAKRITSNPTPPPPPPPPSRPPLPGKNRTWIVIIIVVTVVLSVILVVFVGIWVTKRRKGDQEKALLPNEQELGDNDKTYSRESLQYDFNKIREATDNFSEVNMLGKGGFGVVYKGKLEDGQEIAVKRLHIGSAQGVVEFQNEVILLAKLQHRNLVRLIGFALEGTEKVLIYELIQNASLDHFIFDPIKAINIDWIKRFKIIKGIARGLLYLHEDSRLRIIHRDLKPSNILLDENMNPKITDFGTARLCDQDETHLNTSRIAGTWGYMAPEYVMHGEFSIKSDVFSFGVMVIEIISGQKNNKFKNGNDTMEESLVNFVWRNWHEGTTKNIMDPILRSSSGCFDEIMRCIHIALLCVQQNAMDRPTMASVVLMLSSVTATLPVLSMPTFSGPHTNSVQLVQPTPLSKNDISITDLHPR